MPDLLPPDRPAQRHKLEPTGRESPRGGRVYMYRGYEVHSSNGEHLWTLRNQPEGIPFVLVDMGAGAITGILDGWLDHGALPAPYRMPAGKG